MNTASNPRKGDLSAVTKRLQSELMSMMMAQIPGVSAFPQGDNLLEWVATLSGPDDTVYSGLKYKLTLSFPVNYPFKAPVVKFETKCYHPNVDMSGNICLDILKDKWYLTDDDSVIVATVSPGYSVVMLGEPNNDSPLNAQAANLWTNPEEYRKHVLKHHPGNA